MELREGIRLLLKDWARDLDGGDASETVSEAAVLELSPNKEWVKLRWVGAKEPFWAKARTVEVAVVEELPAREKTTKGFLKEFFEAAITALEVSEMLDAEERSRTQSAQKSD